MYLVPATVAIVNNRVDIQVFISMINIEKSIVHDSCFEEHIRGFRIGSPVMVDGRKTFIKSLPSGGGCKIDGYSVYGDSNCHKKDELKPIPLDDAFFQRHESIFYKSGLGYEYKNDQHILSVTIAGDCRIDDKEFSQIHRHELKTILNELFGISIPLFDDVSMIDNSGSSATL